MNAVPASVAGVKEIIMVVPPAKDGSVNPYVLTAAREAGVTRIFKIGGAQAIAALAFGTGLVPKVDKITGPGNIFVTLAKKAVYGYCDIDMLAGPSEILIVADQTADKRYIAADMLSQAEHDVLASSILITDSAELAAAVETELAVQLEQLPRKEIAQQALQQNGLILVTGSIGEAMELANLSAPEHLEILTAEPFGLLPYVKHAGAVFLGPWSPEPLGDYLAGPNHVLPTGGTARFYSVLNVETFMKKTSIIAYSQQALQAASQQVIRLAEAEGLEAHAKAIRVRRDRPGLDQLKPYSVEETEFPIKLDANERASNLPAAVLQEVTGRLGELAFNRYPDIGITGLRDKIAKAMNLSRDNVVVGNGSSELLAALCYAFGGTGRSIVFPTPSFSMYGIYTKMADSQAVPVPLKADYSLSADEAMQFHGTIEAIVAGAACPVVVDEAYYEFHGHSAIGLLARYPNLIITRTFSKAYGLASARVGYLLAAPELTTVLGKVLMPYHVNALSLAAAEVVYDRRKAFEPDIDLAIRERQRLIDSLNLVDG
ncbi:hypothetical protein Lal_00002542 [Lupinus albus]|nr:hypothetical protein Lal_00002542 [Lupinus albus]